MTGKKTTGGARGVAKTACVLFVLPACSLIYSADDFDVPPDAAVAPDAREDFCEQGDAARFTLDSVEPSRVFEGEGCAWDGDACGDTSRGIPIVLAGCHIPGDATIELSGGLVATPDDAVISAGGRFAAFTVTVPVDPERGQDTSDEVRVSVAGAGGERSITFTVQWLDELVASDPMWDGVIPAGDLNDLYSRVVFDVDVELTGDRPAQFEATSELVLAADLDASGKDGGSSSGGAPGPGGCDGGNPESSGGCNPGGGGPGMTAASQGGGGGGGGHAARGDNGDGDNHGEGGPETGDRTLTPLVDEGGNGGGGGGNASLSNGGGGGGGGGVVELTSRGALVVTAPTAIRARGGGGGTNQCATLNGGGGGGGSGGAILLRAAGRFIDQGTDQDHLSVDVSGGQGAGTANCHRGGDGALGRVRMDLPDSTPLPAAIDDQRFRYRGPMIAPDLASITRDAKVSVTVYGGVGETYWLERVGGEKIEVSTADDRLASRDIELVPGRNRICVLVSEETTAADKEGRNCRDIAYIP